MIECSGVHSVCNYAASSQYMTCPSEEQIDLGVVPLDSLPADWWNWMWHDTNSAVNEAKAALDNLVEELNTVLSCVQMQPVYECTDQLYTAIDLIRRKIGTETVAGAVKSSSEYGNVAIDSATGIMIANGLGNAACLSTTNKTNVVCAVNEVKTIADSKAAVGFTNGCALGTASPGTADTAARSDHVHPMVTCVACAGVGLAVRTGAACAASPTYVLGGLSGSTSGLPVPYCTSCLSVKCAATATSAAAATNSCCAYCWRPILSYNGRSNCNISGVVCVCYYADYNCGLVCAYACVPLAVVAYNTCSTYAGCLNLKSIEFMAPGTNRIVGCYFKCGSPYLKIFRLI